MEEINVNLNIARTMIVLCSPYSVTKPWINFEVGAAWMKGIPIAPLCHSGITPKDLPNPIGNLQSLMLKDQDSISHLYDLIANSVSCSKPSADFQRISQEVLRFEERYIRGLKIGVVTESIYQNAPLLLKELKRLKTEKFQEIKISSYIFDKVKEDLKSLAHLNLLRFSEIKSKQDGPSLDPATHYTLRISMTNELSGFIKRSY